MRSCNSVRVHAQLVLAGNLAVQFTGADEIKTQACVEKGNMQKARIGLQFLCISRTCWTIAANAQKIRIKMNNLTSL